MGRPIILLQAREDLRDIKTFIGKDNKQAAQRQVAAIRLRCDLVARVPGVGAIREDLGPGVRSLPVGAYLIVYRVVSDGVEIIRVLHGHRDLGTLFNR